MEISVETGSPVKCEISKELQRFQAFYKTNSVSYLFTVIYKIPRGFFCPFCAIHHISRNSNIYTGLQEIYPQRPAFFPVGLFRDLFIRRYLPHSAERDFRPVDACLRQVYSEARLASNVKVPGFRR